MNSYSSVFIIMGTGAVTQSLITLTPCIFLQGAVGVVGAGMLNR